MGTGPSAEAVSSEGVAHVADPWDRVLIAPKSEAA